MLIRSADGRLIISPYRNGVRLLSFSPDCATLPHCLGDKPRVLHTLASLDRCHAGTVVSTRCSPTHSLIVTGCMLGRLVWHQPVL